MITINSDGQAISQDFIDAIRSDSPRWISKLFVNGSELQCAIVSWTVTKGSCASIESFTVGDVVGTVFTAELLNLSTNVKGEDIEVRVGTWTGSDYEYITIGVFNVSEVRKNRYSTNITAYGRTITRTGYAFVPPATPTIANIVATIQNATGCTISVDGGITTSYEITAGMANLSLYQALGVVAGVVGGYVCDTADGNIAIHKLDDTATLSVNTGMMVTLPEAEEDDFEITGVKCVVTEELEDEEGGDVPAVEYTSGSPVNVELQNAFMTSDIFNNVLAPNMIGYAYRTATINLTLGDPRLEGNDVLEVTEVDGITTYIVPCHSVSHTYTGGFSSVIVSAKATEQENDIGSSTPLSTTLKIIQAVSARAKYIANKAYQITADTAQYFWFKGTGTDTGAHITEVPQEEFTDPTSPNYHKGGNLLARSNGIAVRDGLTELAQFGVSGAVIGENASGKSRSEIGTSGMQIMQNNGGTDVSIAHLGYGPGTDSGGGTSDAPYYTLGTRTGIVGNYSTAEGHNSTASGYASHAEGEVTTASGYASHAEGSGATASGSSSHAEGSATASGASSHAEGSGATASGSSSHAEGWGSTASGAVAHAEGDVTTASGASSHAQNTRTIASKNSQTAIGTCNIEDTSSTTTHPSRVASYGQYAFIIGNGTSSVRSNALTVDWLGNISALGSLFTGMADEWAKKGDENNTGNTNHFVIAGYHVCFGSASVSATANTYSETEVTLPHTYTTLPLCFASTANRSGQVRTVYGSPKDTSTIYVGGYATATRNVTVVWITIGI